MEANVPYTPESIVSNISHDAQENTFQLKPFIFRCIRNWPWFLVSIVVCCCLGAFYVLRQQPVYTRTAAVLIKDQSSGNSSDMSSAFSSMGLLSTNTDVMNEVTSFTSPSMMFEVVKRLNLRMNYSTPGRFHATTLYGTTLPIDVELPDISNDQSASFKLLLTPDGSITISDFTKTVNGEKEEFDKTLTGRVGFGTYRTPIGRMIVRPNGKFTGRVKEDMEINVKMGSLQNTAEGYSASLTGQVRKDTDVIDLSINDVSRERACDILNTIISVYNEEWVEDKNQVAVATTRFIHDRLAVIEKELGNVDTDISSYKTENLVPDVEASSAAYLQQSVKSDQELLQLNNRLAMAKYVKDYLDNPTHAFTVIPANTGIGNSDIEALITRYNTLLLDRNNMVANSSVNNPQVVEMDANLRGLRESVARGVTNQIVSLSTSIKNTESSIGESKSVIASAPGQAKYLLSVERQQKVKESLYMFLLQKLEENELTQAFTAYNTRIITPPYGSNSPIAPRKVVIMAVAFLIGLMIPAGLIFLRMSMDTKIRSRKDIEMLPVPYAGEIPFDGKTARQNKSAFTNKRRYGPYSANRKNEKVNIVVKEGCRDVVNEAFRVVRNNIDFMTKPEHGDGCLYLTTSFNPGSGKTFVTINLASSFALKRKKVLVIDGDMRHGSTSMIVKSPSKGLSTYLQGIDDDWSSLVVPVTEHGGLDILPVGKIPPNPAELLESPRLKLLLAEARKQYDYIFIDCPPINMVVDTQVFSRLVDRTIFIVRAGLLEKSMINEINNLYHDNTYNYMCLVLNGTKPDDSNYYGHSYYGSTYYGNYYSDK